MHKPFYPTQQRIVLLGSSFIGKSTLLASLHSIPFTQEYTETFEDYIESPFNSEVTYIDTSGSHDFDRLRPYAYRNASHFVLCYASNDIDSFHAITETWLPEILYFCPGCSYSLIALKSDTSYPQIKLQQGHELSLSINAHSFHSCTAFNTANVQSVFKAIEWQLLKPRSPPLSPSSSTTLSPYTETLSAESLNVQGVHEKEKSARSETTWIQLSNNVKVPVISPQKKMRDASTGMEMCVVDDDDVTEKREVGTQTGSMRSVKSGSSISSFATAPLAPPISRYGSVRLPERVARDARGSVCSLDVYEKTRVVVKQSFWKRVFGMSY